MRNAKVTGYQKYSRTPHGVRGLKLIVLVVHPAAVWSHPARGAWIEIQMER